MKNEFSGILFDRLPIMSKDEADKLWAYASWIADLCDIPLLAALVPALDAIAEARRNGKV